MKKILFLVLFLITMNITTTAQNEKTFYGGVNYYAIDMNKGKYSSTMP